MLELNNIHLGDSYELIKLIPDKSIDLIMIDPPYDIETKGGTNNRIGKSMLKIKDELDTIKEGINKEIFKELMRVMKKPNIYIWCNKKQIIEYLDFFVTNNDCSFEILIWEKINPIPLCGGNYLIDKEFCLYFRKGIKLNTTFESAKTIFRSSLIVNDKKDFEHPSIKPLNFIKTLIANSSNENDVVLDCFSGSGTTCIACKEIGRQFIGIEIDDKWHKISVDRLNGINAKGQTSIFTDFESL